MDVAGFDVVFLLRRSAAKPLAALRRFMSRSKQTLLNQVQFALSLKLCQSEKKSNLENFTIHAGLLL